MQFSLKSLMIFFFVVVLLCALTFALPRFIGHTIFSTMLLMLPAALVTGIIYGTGDQQAFAIGGTATLATMIWANGPLKPFSFDAYDRSWNGTLFTTVLTFLILGCAGTVAVGVRRRLVQHGKQPPVSPPPVSDESE